MIGAFIVLGYDGLIMLKLFNELNVDTLEKMRSAIIITDATDTDYPIVYMNSSFETLTGYRREDVIGKNCRFLQGEETDQPSLSTLREAIARKLAVNGFLKNYRKDGSAFYNELFIDPVCDEDGNVTHFFGCQNEVVDFGKVYVLKNAHKGYARLTPWEVEFFKLLVTGTSSQMLAAKFQISSQEADDQTNVILKKFGVTDLTLLIRYAIALGIPFNLRD